MSPHDPCSADPNHPDHLTRTISFRLFSRALLQTEAFSTLVVSIYGHVHVWISYGCIWRSRCNLIWTATMWWVLTRYMLLLSLVPLYGMLAGF
jgi:hypothetical protein